MSFLDGKSVLIVDDEPGIRELFKAEFSLQGCNCIEADSGEAAYELYKTQKFDAILSDIRMPNGDGMYLLKKIIESGENSSFLAFMTGHTDRTVDDFYNQGANLVLQKPFESDIIVKLIEDSLRTPRSQWRQQSRLNTILKMELRWPQLKKSINAITYNMSRRGFFIQTKNEFPEVGSTVEFVIEVKTALGPKIFEGELLVRWVRKESTEDRPSGFGAKFISADTRPMDEIAELVGLDYLFKTS